MEELSQRLKSVDISTQDVPYGKESCTNCNLDRETKQCSGCKGATGRYCSKECQIEHWPIHKPICRPYNANEVWGIKILHNGMIKGKEDEYKKRFQHHLLKRDHPIFTKGEVCPVTAMFGLPLIIYSAALMERGAFAENNNQPAVYLRIEPHDCFAPVHWQMNEPGTCLVMRQDGRPLTRETIETIWQFHAKLLNSSDYPTWDGWAPVQGLMTPASFQFFSRQYYEAQREKGRKGFRQFFSPL